MTDDGEAVRDLAILLLSSFSAAFFFTAASTAAAAAATSPWSLDLEPKEKVSFIAVNDRRFSFFTRGNTTVSSSSVDDVPSFPAAAAAAAAAAELGSGTRGIAG